MTEREWAVAYVLAFGVEQIGKKTMPEEQEFFDAMKEDGVDTPITALFNELRQLKRSKQP